MDWKPVQSSQNGGGMVIFATIFKKFSCSIFNQLKSSYLRLGDTVKQRIAIIQTRSYESVDNCLTFQTENVLESERSWKRLEAMMDDTCLSNVSQLSMRTPRLRTQLKTDRLPRVELLNSNLSDGPKIILLVLESLRVKNLLDSQSLTLSITFKIKKNCLHNICVCVLCIFWCTVYVNTHIQYIYLKIYLHEFTCIYLYSYNLYYKLIYLIYKHNIFFLNIYMYVCTVFIQYT